MGALVQPSGKEKDAQMLIPASDIYLRDQEVSEH